MPSWRGSSNPFAPVPAKMTARFARACDELAAAEAVYRLQRTHRNANAVRLARQAFEQIKAERGMRHQDDALG
jgi:hypothetical protein